MGLLNLKPGFSKNMAKHKVLYIAYDGMTDPLGQSQVLSYLKELSKGAFSFHVISFEKQDVFQEKKEVIDKFIEGYDIHWHPLPYHKSPPILSTLYDNHLAWQKIKELYKEHKFSIVHCRGYTLTSLALKAQKKYGSKFIFDMRGWWPDEKLESGLWSNPIYKPVYHYFKAKERAFFTECDIAVSLTHVGKKAIVDLGLKEADKVDVIPTCVNFDVFKPYSEETRKAQRKAWDIPEDATVFLYSGSVGSNYRTDLVLRFFKKLKKVKANSYLAFLSHSDHNIILDEIKVAGLDEKDCRIKSATYLEVSDMLMVGDVGLIMYNLGFSVIGRSPTKLGEYWASGLTCLSARDIGDLEAIVTSYENSGVLINSLEKEEEYEKGVAEILSLSTDKDKLREYAFDYFALEKGVKAYRNIYNKLLV
ncbi:MAG: glycosyltransferase involved in cell wall biosynthesis [Chitinophagales bacterium]|jgi:glycosyltransferase involved in cell wall biosynthesis